MTDSRSILRLFIICGTIIFAAWLGISITTDQIETIIYLIVGATILFCALLSKKIWLLIPFMFAMNMTLPLPGLPDTGLISQILVLGFSVLLFLMRKLPLKLAWTELESWILLLTLFVAQVYMRNPVGINLFGGDTVGGKSYVIYAISLCTGLLLAGLTVPASDLKWFLRLTIFGGILNFVIGTLSHLVPAFGYYTGSTITRSDETNYENIGKAVDTGSATRRGFLGVFANNAALWISSHISPIRALLRPLWSILIILTLIAAAMSGFRNFMISTGFIILLGIAYRSGFGGLLISIVCGAMALSCLVLLNGIHPLPPTIQRSLTFLPGNWEERYKLDAEASSEWRFEIWREVLLTDRWIQNKWMGDGLGFTSAELAGQMNDRLGARAGVSGFDAHRESILSSGDYHSGPVQTVRTIGYFGLLVLVLAQVRLAVHAHRQIQRCWNTEWLPLAMLIGLPLIAYPVFFFLVFGTFKLAAISLLTGYGMIRLLENNLPLPAWRPRSRQPFILSNSRDHTNGISGN